MLFSPGKELSMIFEQREERKRHLSQVGQAMLFGNHMRRLPTGQLITALEEYENLLAQNNLTSFSDENMRVFLRAWSLTLSARLTHADQARMR
jgi:hypothetical protein